MLSTKTGYGQTTLKKLTEYLKDTFCTACRTGYVITNLACYNKPCML